jgi:peptidyl-tRNA hydrolase
MSIIVVDYEKNYYMNNNGKCVFKVFTFFFQIYNLPADLLCMER